MANPTYLQNANSPVQVVDTLLDPTTTGAYFKLAGPGAKANGSYGNNVAPHAVSSHAVGSGILPADGAVGVVGIYRPTTTLSAAISTTTGTSITVTSASGFPLAPASNSANSGYFRITIDTEDMLVTAGNGTTTWTVTRGYNGTTAATHANAATVTGYVATVPQVDVNGRLLTTSTPTTSATAAITSVAGSATDVTLLASNTNRKGATFYNDSTSILYLSLGTTAASATSYTIQLAANGYYELPFAWTGAVHGIWASATGNARITELS